MAKTIPDRVIAAVEDEAAVVTVAVLMTIGVAATVMIDVVATADEVAAVTDAVPMTIVVAAMAMTDVVTLDVVAVNPAQTLVGAT